MSPPRARGAPAPAPTSGEKRYDREYFERWYRDPARRVKTGEDVERKARMVVAIAEYLLDRPVRSVLDVGCGEGAWRPVLRRLRPAVHYVGVDSSEYAVRRFGARRNLLLGSFAALDAVALRGPFDLVVCCDVLNYLGDAELRRGLPHVRALLGGVAYLEAFTSADEIVGDLDAWHARSPDDFRRLFRRAGLVPCGMHCYVAEDTALDVGALEYGWPGAREARR